MDAAGLPSDRMEACSALLQGGSMKRLAVVLMALAGATSCGYKQPSGEMCGNAGAASFSIPRSEIFMWDKGPGIPPPPGSSANVFGVILMLRWPGMESRSGSNNREFIKTYERSLGSTPWLVVGMQRSDAEFPRERISKKLSFYLETMYAGRGDLEYRDDIHGLRHAVYKSSPGGLYEDIWFFWGGDTEGVVDHYIKCPNSMPDRPPEKLRSCDNVFYMEEINMRVLVRYRNDKLIHWREVQDSVRSHLLSKIEECSVEAGRV